MDKQGLRLIDAPFVKQLPVKKFKNLVVFGSNPEAFAAGDSPLIKNFLDFQTLILPPKGKRFLGVFVPRMTFNQLYHRPLPRKSNSSDHRR